MYIPTVYTLCTYKCNIVQIMYIFCTSVLCTHMYITVNVHKVHILYVDCNIPISVHIMSIFWDMIYSI